jgi:hypothetical protein
MFPAGFPHFGADAFCPAVTGKRTGRAPLDPLTCRIDIERLCQPMFSTRFVLGVALAISVPGVTGEAGAQAAGNATPSHPPAHAHEHPHPSAGDAHDHDHAAPDIAEAALHTVPERPRAGERTES